MLVSVLDLHWPRFSALLSVEVIVNKHRGNKWQMLLKLRNDHQLTPTTSEEESKSHQWSREEFRLPDKISTGTVGTYLLYWWNSTQWQSEIAKAPGLKHQDCFLLLFANCKQLYSLTPEVALVPLDRKSRQLSGAQLCPHFDLDCFSHFPRVDRATQATRQTFEVM